MQFKVGHLIKTENLNRNEIINDSSLETHSEFEVIQMLGQGSFGAVYQVKHLKTNNKFVIV